MVDDPTIINPLNATDFQLSQYADFYYEYDASRRVTKEIVQGGALTYTFSYTQSIFQDGYNTWKRKQQKHFPMEAGTLFIRLCRKEDAHGLSIG